MTSQSHGSWVPRTRCAFVARSDSFDRQPDISKLEAMMHIMAVAFVRLDTIWG